MYNVRVYYVGTQECVDAREFEYGTWKEIGFWLDEYGYIDPQYRVSVIFG